MEKKECFSQLTEKNNQLAIWLAESLPDIKKLRSLTNDDFVNATIYFSNLLSEFEKFSQPEFYRLIADESILDQFINWLPELKPNEKYYISLFARKKYAPNLKSDKAQLKRVLATKDRIKEKIRQMEIPYGGYKVDGEVVPQEALAIYITPNPRSLTGAMKQLAKQLVDAGFEGRVINPVSEALTAVHQNLSKSYFKDFDFDGVDLESTLMVAYSVINKSAVHILKTRGGFHLLVELSKIEKEFEKKWYMGLSSLQGCDVRGDNLIPIPGCIQGNFIPNFV